MQTLDQKYDDSIKSQIESMFDNGMTYKEIGQELNIPRRTVGKLCQEMGLSRSTSDTAKLVLKSHLDNEQTIKEIMSLRSTHSLQEIATKFNSSISAVQRICNKYSILPPENFDELQSKRMQVIWTDEKKMLASIASQQRVTDELRQQLSEGSKQLWKDDKYRRIQSEKRAAQSWGVSSIQTQLYEILEDLNIEFFREYDDAPNDPETVIGPYNFDCAIPRKDQPTLLIECHGDYWHSLDKAIIKDNQKKSFIQNNFSEYELKYLWEHEFKCKDKIYELVKYWVGVSEVELIDFAFDDVQLMKIDVKTANKLLDKYHYLSGCGRGGIVIGAFIGGNLIAVCAFSTLLRGNMPYDKDKTRELSRFCIHPRYQKKNFGSWMITRCIKMLPAKITTIISYCDTTFNHDGALYKACNFRLDGEVRSDYWYVNEGKWIMHKKTLYNHACKMGLKEREFAEKEGYKRVYGDKKLRFIFEK